MKDGVIDIPTNEDRLDALERIAGSFERAHLAFCFKIHDRYFHSQRVRNHRCHDAYLEKFTHRDGTLLCVSISDRSEKPRSIQSKKGRYHSHRWERRS